MASEDAVTRKHLLALAVLLLPLLAGCACDQYGVVGLHVDIVDAQTRDPVRDATLIVRDGDYIETDSGPPPFHAAFERSGTYEVTIRVPGYEVWRRDGVRVRQTGITCPHPETRHLTAYLDPVTALLH